MSTFVAATKTDATSGSFSAAAPAGLASGHVQYAWITSDGFGNTLSISGGATWTALTGNLGIANGDTATVRLFRQVAGGAEPANYTVTNSGATATTVIIRAESGVNTTTPEATALTTSNPDSASPPASPVSMTNSGVTTTAANQKVLWFGFVDWNSATAAAFTAPGSFSVQTNCQSTPAQFSNGIIADRTYTSAGATGAIDGTGTLAAQSGNFVTISLALLDAASASVPRLSLLGVG